MLIAAINFQSNLSYGLTFLLMTLFVIAILHTYANLSGLTIRALGASPAFPGQRSEFSLMVERSKRRDHFGLYFHWPGGSETVVSLVEENSIRFHLHVPVATRGWFSPGRLLLESTYPLGLLRCWTWIDLDISALVYPKPLASSAPQGLSAATPEGAAATAPGNDDFFGFRDYRIGDSLRQVHWKGVAKRQGVQTKQYTAYIDRSVWLDWEQFPAAAVEQRLSHLCYWALEFEERGQEYGLRLPGVTIQPAMGEKHRDRVLKEMALFSVAGDAG